MQRRVLSVFGLIALLASCSFGYLAGRTDLLAPARITAADNCQTFTETGKTVCGVFLTYWRDHGGLAQQGFPISDEMDETSGTPPKTVHVQYFERAVFEAHPENAPPYNVLLALLGSEKYRAKYGSNAPASTAPQPTDASVASPTPTAPAPTPTFGPTANPSGITFISLKGAAPGSQASVAIQGPSSTVCTIAFTTPNGITNSISGLGPKTTTANGLIAWTWTISSDTKVGVGNVAVTCAGKTAVAPIPVIG